MEFEVVPIITVGGNAYLLKGKHIALVDTLHPKAYKKIEKALSDEGVSVGDIEFVLVTHNHFDHAGNVAKIKSLSGAKVIAGAEDAGLIEGTELQPPLSRLSWLGKAMSNLPKSWVDRYQKFDKTMIELPGHTGGGVGYLDRELKRAFIGDIVSYFYSRPGMPALVASESLEDIYASQELLAGLDLRTAYPGHGKIIEPDASKIIGVFLGKKKG
jgi:glyoxylase-like metal-dependent hydrolase (beta-lactamase superfamily II)